MDSRLATSLQQRTTGKNVAVKCGDAAAMAFPERSFASVVCFTMLHHVPSAQLQDRLFAEVYRVLRPGGIFAGTDSRRSLLMQLFHLHDTMVLVDPMKLPARLESAGFADVDVELRTDRFRFSAMRPA
jgi:SAM-dependent methyltransferase